jgi:FlaA1/EpsC-like NDP-sugar epimerase
MTIPEACSLVLKTGGVGRSGQTYLLDMGEPVRIRDLAEQMIRFYGYEPGRDIKIEYIGLRHGERVEERLYSPEEVLVPTEYPRINRLERRSKDSIELAKAIAELEGFCLALPGREKDYRNRRALRAVLKKSVPALIVPENESEY